MIITRAPLRISFLGGGTDIPEYFTTRSGLVIGSTIDKYVYVNSLPLHESSREIIRFTYRITESVNSIQELEHPSLRESLKLLKFNKRLNIATMSDLPGGTGLGSSSSFLVALLFALHKEANLEIEHLEIAKLAIQIERDILKERGGWQDQLHAAIGGFRTYSFNGNGFQIGEKLFENHELEKFSGFFSLVPTSISRKSSKFSPRLNSVNTLNFEYLEELNRIAHDFLKYLPANINEVEFINFLAKSVNASWEIKSKLLGNSVIPEVKTKINEIMDCGALAVKEVGAGGGGFILVIHNKNEFSAKKFSKLFPGIVNLNLVDCGVNSVEF